jgi:nucleoside-diphosphate-sugar epimerase
LPATCSKSIVPTPGRSADVDYLVYCAAATEHDEAGYRKAYVEGLQHVLEWLDDYGQQPKQLVFVSSSSVYGQQNGEWVDEASPTQALGYSGQVMLEAEQVAFDSGIPATTVRLTGIYGPGREWLLRQVRQGYRVAVSRRCTATGYMRMMRQGCWRFCCNM